MSGEAGEREKIIEREIPVADSIEAVCSNARKAKKVSYGLTINRERISGKRARTHGAGVSASSGVSQARDVAREGFRVRDQKMRKQNRLCVLHVRHAGHRHSELGFCLQDQCVYESQKAALDF